MSALQTVLTSIQRGLVRPVLNHDDGTVTFENTAEGTMVEFHLRANLPVPCVRCGKPYPKPGVLPKYSECGSCRANHIHFYMPRPK